MIPKTSQHLRDANNWRRIRKQCIPLFTLAQGKPGEVQAAIHQTMLCQIEAVLEGTA